MNDTERIRLMESEIKRNVEDFELEKVYMYNIGIVRRWEILTPTPKLRDADREGIL